VLGSRWVADRGDDLLGSAAENAIAKIAAVLPAGLRENLEAANLLAAPGQRVSAGTIDLAVVRKAIRTERKLSIRYRDGRGAASQRMIWPFALGFFDRVHAWCELRQDFRHFRTDRIASLAVAETRYPRRRQALLKEWRLAEDIPAPP
jgi:predicted DNA-binding transcriptional regulator YafY